MGNAAVFRKTGAVGDLAMFEAEAEGLAAIAATGTVRVPDVHAVGTDAAGAYIEMERLDLRAPTGECDARLGRELAAMHRAVGECFGWHRDNTIGLTPQPNPRCGDWIDFYREHRLLHQLRLAGAKGYGGELQDLGARVAERLADLFDGYVPEPSLLHGDLWAGNRGMTDGTPVVYDPAVYYGDRETDLAMTRLFGGFGPGFYSAYEDSWPLAAGWQAREALYQLYHVLNHLNLFGSGYLGRALDLLRGLDSR